MSNTEIWPGLNKDGDGANSNISTIGTSPALIWSKNYTKFPILRNDNVYGGGRRQNNLCIRNGEILVVTPKVNPVQPLYTYTFQMADPLVEILSLNDGSNIRSYYAPIISGSCLRTKVGTQGSDLQNGLFSIYWDRDNVVYYMTGGDWGTQGAFLASSGVSFDKTPYANGGSNRSGFFTMHNDGPGYFAGGGGDGHTSWSYNAYLGRTFSPKGITGSGSTLATIGDKQVTAANLPAGDYVNQICQIRNTNTGLTKWSYVKSYDPITSTITFDNNWLTENPVPAIGSTLWMTLNINKSVKTTFILKEYGATLIKGNKAYPYTCWGFRSAYDGSGINIQCYDLGVNVSTTPNYTYEPKLLGTFKDPIQSFLGFGGPHCAGAPRPLCITDAGKVCYFGYTAKGTVGSPGNSNTGTLIPDPAIPLSLTVLSDTLVKLANIPTTYKYQNQAMTYAQRCFPQTATLGKYVVVFMPQQSQALVTQARLFCFDVDENKLVWEYTYSAGQFLTNTFASNPIGAGTEQAVQMVMAGNQVVVAEPYIEATSKALMLRVYRHNMVDGKIIDDNRYICKRDGVDGLPITGVEPMSVCLREMAIVDGSLVVLIDYRTPNIYNSVTVTTTWGDTCQWLGVIRGNILPPPPPPPPPTPIDYVAIDAAVRLQVTNAMTGKLYQSVAEVIVDLEAIE